MSDIRIQKTGEPDILQTSDGRLTLSVPIQIKRRSGRKLVTLPNGETAPVRPWDVAPTSIQLALARGHRWLAMLESGEAKSLKEIATREGIDNSYVSRMVNLTRWHPTSWRPSWTTHCRTTSRCLIWRLIRQRCGMSSGPGSCRPSGGTGVKLPQVPTLLAHE